MDNAIDLLLRQGTVALAIVVVIGTFFARRIVETAVPSIKQQAHENSPQVTYPTKLSEWWNKVILYAIPPFFGGLAGMLQIPFVFPPEQFHTTGGRIIFGIGVGWFSSFIYKVLKNMISKSTGVELPSGSTPPEAPI